MVLQLGNLKPLGLWPGVWALISSTLLFVMVSWVTPPPKGAAAFLDSINALLAEKKVL
jgi:SSS family solute:Na+ symporter